MDIYKILMSSPLFKKFSLEKIEFIVRHAEYIIKNFKKTEYIAFENDKCDSIGIILTGNIEIYKQYETGDKLSIGHFGAGDIFGEVIVFSTVENYPASVVSIADTDIMFIKKENILKLCSLDTEFLEVFMNILSMRILMLNKRLKTLSHKSIRTKIVSFLLDEYDKTKTSQFNVSLSRKEMADYLGIQRPSLSRELSLMKNEGYIDYYLNTFKIVNLKLMLSSLM